MEHCKRNGIAPVIRGFLWLLLLLATNCSICMSQGIKVISVEETNSGTDAFHAPNGKDGMPCGLVKVKSTFTDLSFLGQIVGDVDNKTNEYYIYMEKGTTELTVSRPNVLPVVVHFPDYGIECITSKATYSVQIKEVKLNPKKNTVTIDIKPRVASIFIDDMPISTDINDNGHYQILLPKGSHFCRFEAEGYSPYVQGINIGKENLELLVELESQLSDLDIICQTPLTSIYINDSIVGREAWKGKLLSGTYKVDVKKDGYITYTQNIFLNKKEKHSIIVPELNRIKAKVEVKTTPIAFCNATIDGFKVDNFPIELEVGEHQLLLQSYGCESIKKNIFIADGKDTILTYNLSTKNKCYEKAYKGDLEMMMAIADNKLLSSKNEKDILEGKYWLSKLFSKKEQLNTSFLSRTFFDDYNKVDTYDKFKIVEEAIGNVSYIGYKNYIVLFWLFCLKNVGEYEKALSIIEKVQVFHNEFNARLCYDIADCYYKTKNKMQALFWYNRCIERDDGGGIASLTEKCNLRIKELNQK
jgi:hypothetical protein